MCVCVCTRVHVCACACMRVYTCVCVCESNKSSRAVTSANLASSPDSPLHACNYIRVMTIALLHARGGDETI